MQGSKLAKKGFWKNMRRYKSRMLRGCEAAEAISQHRGTRLGDRFAAAAARDMLLFLGLMFPSPQKKSSVSKSALTPLTDGYMHGSSLAVLFLDMLPSILVQATARTFVGLWPF